MRVVIRSYRPQDYEPVVALVTSVLAEYGNTSSCGSILVFHERRQGMRAGDVGVVTSFGAGYSAGCIVLRKARG